MDGHTDRSRNLGPSVWQWSRPAQPNRGALHIFHPTPPTETTSHSPDIIPNTQHVLIDGPSGTSSATDFISPATVYIRLHNTDYIRHEKVTLFPKPGITWKKSYPLLDFWMLIKYHVLAPLLVKLWCAEGEGPSSCDWQLARKHLVECGRFGQVAARSRSCCCLPGCTTAHNLQSTQQKHPLCHTPPQAQDATSN